MAPPHTSTKDASASMAKKKTTKTPNNESKVAKQSVDGFLISQHPLLRRFRESLQDKNPQFLYYLAACQLYEGEANLPTGVQRLIKEWLEAGWKEDEQPDQPDQPEEDDGQPKNPRQKPVEIRFEQRKRRAILQAFRYEASDLGYASPIYTALSQSKRCVELTFIGKAKPGHTPGNRKGINYGKAKPY